MGTLACLLLCRPDTDQKRQNTRISQRVSNPKESTRALQKTLRIPSFEQQQLREVFENVPAPRLGKPAPK